MSSILPVVATATSIPRDEDNSQCDLRDDASEEMTWRRPATSVNTSAHTTASLSRGFRNPHASASASEPRRIHQRSSTCSSRAFRE